MLDLIDQLRRLFFSSSATTPALNSKQLNWEVAIRQCVSELLLATTTGFVLRFVGEDLRTQILAELRWCISAKASCVAASFTLEPTSARVQPYR